MKTDVVGLKTDDRTVITQCVEKIIAILDEKKAENVIVLDVHEKTTVADYFIIASGHASRQIAAMADYIADEGKKMGVHPQPTIEGLTQAEWVLIDLGSIIVHLFKPEIRDRYSLEKMWAL